MPYKAVMFDLDGTLLDTLKDLLDAVNYGLSNLGFPLHGSEEFKYFVGEGREVLAARSLPEAHRDPDTILRLAEYINQYYWLHWADHTHPYAGIPELLDTLTAKGIQMSILSNKPQEFTEVNASRLLSRWHFAVVRGALPSEPRKPDCTVALKMARQMNVDPTDFLYLGDSDIDMITAISACMYPVGALWGFRTAEELIKAGAKKLVEKPADLLELLG